MQRLRRSLFTFSKVRGFVFGRLKALVVLRLTCDQVGRYCTIIGRRPRIWNNGTIRVGDGFRIDARSRAIEIIVERGGHLVFGPDSKLNQGVQIYVRDEVLVGRGVGIGSGTHIYDTNSHPVKPGSKTRTSPVVIGDDVWIGMNCIILPGSRIGRGCVIGAGSIVKGELAPGSIFVAPDSRVVSTFEVPDEFRRYPVAVSLIELIRRQLKRR